MDASSKQMGDDLDLGLLARLHPDKVMVASSWPSYRQIPVLELREVVALSVNLDPIFADIAFAMREANHLGSDLEAVLIRFAERHVIAGSNLEPVGALPVHERHDNPARCKVRLADFATFADGIGWDLPEEFPRNAAPASSQPEKSLATRERNTLLTIIAAICDYSAIKYQERGMASQISNMTQEIGVPVDDDTIRNVLAKIPGALEARKK